MQDSNIYITLWQKYKAVILTMMQTAIETPTEYQLSKHEFEAIGDRLKSGYSFNLEIKNGAVTNNIEGTAVARDLFEMLKLSKTAMTLLKNNNFKINLTKNFTLNIHSLR